MASKEAAKKQAKVAARKQGDKPAKAAKQTKVRNPWAFEKLEADIVRLEAERAKLLAEMEQPENYSDAGRMADLQYRHAELERDLDNKNEQWANWS